MNNERVSATVKGQLSTVRSLLSPTKPQVEIENAELESRKMVSPVEAMPPPSLRAASGPKQGRWLPMMSPDEMADVLRSLRSFLSGFEGARHRQPSVALIERAILKHGAPGIEDVPVSILRHARRSLDEIDLDSYGPGLVVVRRRIEQILRRRYGERFAPSSARLPLPSRGSSPASPVRDFSDSLTVFIELDATAT